jgi:hypothetical protein
MVFKALDPADDGPEVRIIRREEIVQFVDWVEVNVGEVPRERPSRSWFYIPGVRRSLAWLELLWNKPWF